MSNIIKVKNLSFSYKQSTVLKDLTFEVQSGDFVAIAGPNGAGKSTLLNLLCGLLNSDKGQIEIHGSAIQSYSVKDLAQKIAVVRQEFIPAFDFTVAQVVAMARTPYTDTFGFENDVDKKLIAGALEMTDTAEFANRPIASLSAGERQRVFIARAFAQDTPILLLDEPTSFLDLKHQVDIYDLLKIAQQQKGKTIVIVTHDINLAAQYTENALLLADDSSYCHGPAGQIFTEEQIELTFGVKTFAGRVDSEKFFLPLGKFAKDAKALTDRQ
ncbi:ABC transporter ATP-binding protein [Planctomycetota bacterium]